MTTLTKEAEAVEVESVEAVEVESVKVAEVATLLEFTVTVKELNHAIAQCIRAVPSRAIHPILVNLLLVVSDDSLTLTGYDLALGIQITIPAAVRESGSVTLPAKLLADIVSRLPEGDLHIIVDTDMIATLQSESGRYTLRALESSEYPDLITVSGDVVELPVAELRQALQMVLFSVSNDETKQLLTGVNLVLTADGYNLAATDGHRLAVSRVLSDVGCDPAEVTLPGKALDVLLKLLPKNDQGSVQMVLERSLATIKCGNTTLNIRALEGQYPNYNQLIPTQFAHELVIDRQMLLTSLERIAVLADLRNNTVKFELMEAQELVLAVDAADVGSGREVMSAQITGNGLVIVFRAKYVLDALKAISTKEVVLNFNTPTSPGIFKPLGGANSLGMIMPVQLRD